MAAIFIGLILFGAFSLASAVSFALATTDKWAKILTVILITLITLLLMSISEQVKAGEYYQYPDKDKSWRIEDTKRELVYIGITSIDWVQTHEIVKNPNKYYEMNPLLGEHPSMAKVNIFVPLAMMAHYTIARLLPYDFRETWQYIFIAVEAGAVINNYAIGIRVPF